MLLCSTTSGSYRRLSDPAEELFDSFDELSVVRRKLDEEILEWVSELLKNLASLIFGRTRFDRVVQGTSWPAPIPSPGPMIRLLMARSCF